MYAVTVLPLDSFTLATFRMAELGFLGLVVKILEQTPLTKGRPSKAGTRLTGGLCAALAPRRHCCSVTAWELEALKRRCAAILVDGEDGRVDQIVRAWLLGEASNRQDLAATRSASESAPIALFRFIFKGAKCNVRHVIVLQTKRIYKG
jgi:hypothetical protein